MLKRVRLLPSAAVVLAATLASAAAGAGLIPTFMGDHSLCCGPGKGYGAVPASGNAAGSGTGPLARADASSRGGGGSDLAATIAAAAPAPAPAPSAQVAAAAPKPADAKTEAKPAASAAFENVDGYLKVGFDRLGGFRYVPPADAGAAATTTATTNASPAPQGASEAQIPSDIKALDGKKTIVTGFMLPVKLEEGLVTEFLLVKDPMMCCYGVVPNVNEWVVVRMAKGVKPLMDVPVAFHGTLRVKEMFENGFLAGIYLLEGEKMGAVGS